MEQIILIIAALLTSSISAVTGVGGGIILLGIMAILIPEGYMVIALHGIIQMVSNGTRTFVFRGHIKKNLISEYFIGAIVGLGLSIFIVYVLMHFHNVTTANQISFDYLKPIIGLYILWYLYLRGPKKEQKNKLFIIVGFISGISSIFIGAVGPLIAPFFLRSDLNKENIIAFCKSLKYFSLAESLGGVESLICHPATMTHASVDDKTKNLLGIDDALIRLSIGCEDTNDLISDILFALNKF